MTFKNEIIISFKKMSQKFEKNKFKQGISVKVRNEQNKHFVNSGFKIVIFHFHFMDRANFIYTTISTITSVCVSLLSISSIIFFLW